MSSAQTSTGSALEQVLTSGAVRSVYQPIVDLAGGEVVAFEALARGAVGSELEFPDLLFAAAVAERRVAELDELCMRTAISGAAGLDAATPLFVNVEPTTLDSDLVARTAPVTAAGGRTIVLEITERAIASAPGELLRGVAAAREHGWRIALDDVGVERASLALLPIIRPEIVKLDMGLVRSEPDIDLGRTMAAVMAYAERTGAIVLAEGIETDEHLDRAIALGAVWGQGYRFGRPGELPEPAPGTPSSTDPLPAFAAPRHVAGSPYDAVVATGASTRTASKRVLLQISHHIEEQAGSDPCAPLLLSAFQEARHLTPATIRRYERFAEHCAIVGALGMGIDPAPIPGVRGARLLTGDPLTGEWSVVVLGPHYCGALLGRDLGDDGPDPDRRFSFVVTHDRGLVELAAESLLRRLLAV